MSQRVIFFSPTSSGVGADPPPNNGWLPEVEGDPMALAFAHESLKCAVVETHLKRPGFGGMIGRLGSLREFRFFVEKGALWTTNTGLKLVKYIILSRTFTWSQ